MKHIFLRYFRFSFALVVLTLVGCNSSSKNKVYLEEENKAKTDLDIGLVYYNELHLQLVKKRIKEKDSYFNNKYHEVLKEGQAALDYVADPVTNKTQIPPSKDLHDYLSYAPYRWPDASKLDGLPWIARDGIINPVSLGADTDFSRNTAFFDAIEKLTWSYYFSEDKRFAEKAIELIKVWYLNLETRVNPNINFGQAVPGLADGRKAGVHEWCQQSQVITAMQMFENDGILPKDVKQGMDIWFNDYLHWLITNPMAIEAGLTRQNHANHYNYQVVGLMMYLGKNEEAKQVVEDAKQARIADQIMPDGSQPREMGRTKSVQYATLNLWSMTELTLMGQKLGIDLWAYETKEGRSLKKAYSYLTPFVLGIEKWPQRQITEGGPEKAINKYMVPVFSMASTALDTILIDPKFKTYTNLKPLDALRYPPINLLHRKN
ncbi:alginate lyase family protein [Algibacter lectus]|uniref:alginate lyase family protein n=1 Tax=Algibacter lectus TaxID=221126 RepID=UPI002494405C|nr:alginate lyase family protein [Algibacter lectus]